MTTRRRQDDELGWGSKKLSDQARKNIRIFTSGAKIPLGPIGSAAMALVMAILASTFWAFGITWVFAGAFILIDTFHGVTDWLVQNANYVALLATAGLIWKRVSSPKQVAIPEGWEGMMSLFDGWLQRQLGKWIRLTPGTHWQFLSFQTIYPIIPSFEGYERKVEQVICRGVEDPKTKGTRRKKVIPVDGSVTLKPVEVVCDLRTIDGVVYVQAISRMGVDGVMNAIDQFIDNATRDGLSPLSYTQVERAEERDRCFEDAFWERHKDLVVELPDGDQVIPVPQTGMALTKIWIQEAIADDKTLLASRAKPSVAVAEGTALNAAHDNLLKQVRKQVDETGIQTATDPLAAALAQTGEVDMKGLMLATNMEATGKVATVVGAYMAGQSQQKGGGQGGSNKNRGRRRRKPGKKQTGGGGQQQR